MAMPTEQVTASSRSSISNRQRHLLDHLLRHLRGVGGALHLRQHDDELVAADAADGVALA